MLQAAQLLARSRSMRGASGARGARGAHGTLAATRAAAAARAATAARDGLFVPHQRLVLTTILFDRGGFSVSFLQSLVSILPIQDIGSMLSACREMHEYEDTLYVAPERLTVASSRECRITKHLQSQCDTSHVVELTIEDNDDGDNDGGSSDDFWNNHVLELMINNDFPSLASLTLKGCDNRLFDKPSWWSALARCTQICSLKISCNMLDFEKILEFLTQGLISSLEISCDECFPDSIDVEKMASLTQAVSRLSQVTLRFTSSDWCGSRWGSHLTDETLDTLSRVFGGKLSSLDLSFSDEGNDFITDTGVRYLSERCPQLTYLNLTGCYGIPAEEYDNVRTALLQGCPHLSMLKFEKERLRSPEEIQFREAVYFTLRYSRIAGIFEDDIGWTNGFDYRPYYEPGTIDWTDHSISRYDHPYASDYLDNEDDGDRDNGAVSSSSSSPAGDAEKTQPRCSNKKRSDPPEDLKKIPSPCCTMTRNKKREKKWRKSRTKNRVAARNLKSSSKWKKRVKGTRNQKQGIRRLRY